MVQWIKLKVGLVLPLNSSILNCLSLLSVFFSVSTGVVWWLSSLLICRNNIQSTTVMCVGLFIAIKLILLHNNMIYSTNIFHILIRRENVISKNCTSN